MQDKSLFEYAVIRIVPMVEREEFMNAGVVLYCQHQQFLQVLYQLDRPRLLAFSGKMDLKELNAYLRAFQRISAGDNTAGPAARLPLAERFRWLTAARSTVVQTSKVHPGLCRDAGETLRQLYRQLVVPCT